MPTPKNVEAVASLRDKLEKAQSVVLADFTGLDAQKINELRREFRNNDSELLVIKNTLGILAARESGMADLEQYLEGPTAWAMAHKDPTAPARVLKEFRKLHKLPRVKGGFIDGIVISPDQVRKVADIPPKPVLVAQILGLIQSSTQGIGGVLRAVMTSVVVAVDEIKKQKETGGGS